MWKVRLLALFILVAGVFAGSFIYNSETNEGARFPFKFGLDLSGGTHLIYKADTSSIQPQEVKTSMDALRDVIERRVNLFGVSEPIVQVERGGRFAGVPQERLIVELPGVTDVAEAVALIGRTPLLEFKLLVSGDPTGQGTAIYIDTGLTGRLVKRAQLEFGNSNSGGLSNEPVVILNFNKEGSDLFETLTSENVGQILGIFLKVI